MFDCFKTWRAPTEDISNAKDHGGSDESSTDEQMQSGPTLKKRSKVSVSTAVQSMLTEGDAAHEALEATIKVLDEAIQAERTTWSKKFTPDSDFAKLMNDYHLGYQQLREDRLHGRTDQHDIESRATALGTLLAQAYDLANEKDWNEGTKKRCKNMGEAYVDPSVFVNDLSSGLLIAKTLLGLALDIAAVAAPTHAIGLKTAKASFNIAYAVLQSFVTCCVGIVGSGTNQSKVVQETAFAAPRFMPDQPTISYKDWGGNDAPPPSMAHVKRDLKLVKKVIEASLNGRGAIETMEKLVRRKARTKHAIGQMTKRVDGKSPELTGPEKLKLKRLTDHLNLIKDLLKTLASVDGPSRDGDGPLAPLQVHGDLRTHRTRLIDELAVGDRMTRTNVQHNVGDGKWVRSMLNMCNGLASVIKAGHEIASNASGYDSGKITASVVSTVLSLIQVFFYRSTQGSASGGDHCNKIACLFALISQTELGNLRQEEDLNIDHKKLDKLVIGPFMTRMKTMNKVLKFRSNVLMSAIIGHIKSADALKEIPGRLGERSVPLTYAGLQKKFNALIKKREDEEKKAKKKADSSCDASTSSSDDARDRGSVEKTRSAIDDFVGYALSKVNASGSAVGQVNHLLEMLGKTDLAAKYAEEGNLHALHEEDLLDARVMQVLIGSLSHARFLYDGIACDDEARARWCDERLIRWGAETEIRVRTGNGPQIASKGGVAFANGVGGNGSFFAIKAGITVASSTTQLIAGFDNPCSDWIDLVGSLFSCVGPVCGSTSGYSYRNTKLKNDMRAAYKVAGVVVPPNSGIQKKGERDFMPVFSVSSLRRRAEDFDTLIPPQIDVDDLPPPFDYECETSVLREMWDQAVKPVPLFSTKLLRKWASPPTRKPGGLDPDPMATLGKAGLVPHFAAREKDSSSGSESTTVDGVPQSDSAASKDPDCNGTDEYFGNKGKSHLKHKNGGGSNVSSVTTTVPDEVGGSQSARNDKSEDSSPRNAPKDKDKVNGGNKTRKEYAKGVEALGIFS
jgi:hypothetical protein